jgi:hypothetical protein
MMVKYYPAEKSDSFALIVKAEVTDGSKGL